MANATVSERVKQYNWANRCHYALDNLIFSYAQHGEASVWVVLRTMPSKREREKTIENVVSKAWCVCWRSWNESRFSLANHRTQINCLARLSSKSWRESSRCGKKWENKIERWQQHCRFVCGDLKCKFNRARAHTHTHTHRYTFYPRWRWGKRRHKNGSKAYKMQSFFFECAIE